MVTVGRLQCFIYVVDGVDGDTVGTVDGGGCGDDGDRYSSFFFTAKMED